MLSRYFKTHVLYKSILITNIIHKSTDGGKKLFKIPCIKLELITIIFNNVCFMQLKELDKITVFSQLQKFIEVGERVSKEKK